MHNAGVAASTHPIEPVAAAKKSEMMRCFEVNCCGPLLLTQALLPLLQLPVPLPVGDGAAPHASAAAAPAEGGGELPAAVKGSRLPVMAGGASSKVLFVGSDMGCVSSTVAGWGSFIHSFVAIRDS